MNSVNNFKLYTNEQTPFCFLELPQDVMIDGPSATTGLNLMTPGCWSEDGRSARSTFLPLEAAQGLISNDLKQIGGQIKGTLTDFLF